MAEAPDPVLTATEHPPPPELLERSIEGGGAAVLIAKEKSSEEDWEKTMAVNLRGVFLLSKYAVPQMRKQGGGVIIHNASVLAVKGAKDRAAYTASKGGVWALTKAMAADYASENIRVNCICPGTIHTPSLQQRISSSQDPRAALANFVARHPVGRLGTVEEIAAGVLYLASDEAAFVTGTTLLIDGGMSM